MTLEMKSLLLFTDNCLRVTDHPCLNIGAGMQQDVYPVYLPTIGLEDDTSSAVECLQDRLGFTLDVVDSITDVIESYEDVKSVLYVKSDLEPYHTMAVDLETLLEERGIKAYGIKDSFLPSDAKMVADIVNEKVARLQFRDYKFNDASLPVMTNQVKHIKFASRSSQEVTVAAAGGGGGGGGGGGRGGGGTRGKGDVFTVSEDIALDLVTEYIKIGRILILL